MKNREIFLWTITIALIGGIIFYISINKNQTTLDVKSFNTSASATTTKTNTVKKVTTSTKATSSPTIPTYSLSDLSKHNNQTSCWTAVNGKIYDITSFISTHPAGISKILKGCGVDGTNMYGRVGAHDVSRLTNAFVGNLQ
jgi:cytochrome b involved in lipid metabolism